MFVPVQFLQFLHPCLHLEIQHPEIRTKPFPAKDVSYHGEETVFLFLQLHVPVQNFVKVAESSSPVFLRAETQYYTQILSTE